jgi:hypothetical protein
VALSEAGLGRPHRAHEAFAAAHSQFASARYHFMTAASVKWELMEDALMFRAEEPQGVERLCAEYERVWSQTGAYTAWEGSRALLPLYPPLIVAGRWDDVRAAAAAYYNDAYLRIDALAALAEIERYRGERVSAWSRIHQALPDGPATEPGTPFFVRTLALQRIAAALALDEQRLDLALEWTAAHEQWLAWSGRVLDRAWSALLRARHAELSGDLHAAAAFAATAVASAGDPRQPLALLAAQRMAGHLTTLLGRYDDATREIDAALAIASACRPASFSVVA